MTQTWHAKLKIKEWPTSKTAANDKIKILAFQINKSKYQPI